MNRDFGELAESLRRTTVQVMSGGHGAGSGIVWNASGQILTNAHVVHNDAAQVELHDGRRLRGKVVKRDHRRDLALLQVDGLHLAYATPGDSSRLRPGEAVVAIGNPLGFAGALSTGVVQALGPVNGLGTTHWIQSSARLAPGNSGGPLADSMGKVIGVNTMVLAPGSTQTLALSIPVNDALKFLARPEPVRLGVTVRPVRAREGVGLIVIEVEKDSLAERSSLLAGDVLVGANGEGFRSLDDLAGHLERRGTVRLDFTRGGEGRIRHVSVAAAA